MCANGGPPMIAPEGGYLDGASVNPRALDKGGCAGVMVRVEWLAMMRLAMLRSGQACWYTWGALLKRTVQIWPPS